MAKLKDGPSKSESIRLVLTENPKMTAREVVAALADKGIQATDGLVYFVKGRMTGKKGWKKKVGQMVEKVAVTTGNHDAVATIIKVKKWAAEVGGMKKLKALVEALSE